MAKKTKKTAENKTNSSTKKKKTAKRSYSYYQPGEAENVEDVLKKIQRRAKKSGREVRAVFNGIQLYALPNGSGSTASDYEEGQDWKTYTEYGADYTDHEVS